MKKLIIIASMLGCVSAFAQQEPQYTQNQFNSNLEINPAYAGAHDIASLSLRYRSQWVGFEGAPNTVSLNGESRIYKDILGLGLTVINDRIGVLNSTSADLSIASHIRVSQNGKIAAGLKFGLDFLNSNFSKLSNVDLTDPLYQDESATIFYMGLGALYYTKKIYIGLSCPRIVSFDNASPQTKISKPHYFIYGGYRIELNDGIELRPAILGKYQAQAPFEMDFAMDVWYEQKVGFGASYRTNDAVAFMVKMKIRNLYLGYSYDMTVSKLRNVNNGTHEVYLGYEFAKKKSGDVVPDRNKNTRYF
jgi:type IX secretion system PorP/SprF family membrane protein